MIHVRGKGEPGDLARPILHHAQGVRDSALAILAGLWAHDAHRDETRQHELHIGTGGNGWNLYLDSGEKFAFRGGVAPEGYDRIEVHTGSIRPLGPIVLTIRDPEETEELWQLLDDALAGSRTVRAG